MASPQPDKYTQFSNELLEAVYRFPFSGAQLRVVLAVVRASYGWKRKCTEPMGYKRLARETVMARGAVQKAVQKLVELHVLARGNDGCLALQKDYEKWLEEAPKKKAKRGLTSSPGASPIAPKGASTVAPGGAIGGAKRGLTSSPGGDIGEAPYKDKEIRKERKKTDSGAEAPPRKLTAVQEVIRGFKIAKGLDPDDKDWDKLHFKRFIRAAEDLLKIFAGNHLAAVMYTIDKGDKWNEKMPTWGLEGVARNAATDPETATFIKAAQEDGNGGVNHEREHGAVDAGGRDGRRRRAGATRAGDLVGDALAGLQKSAQVSGAGPADVAGSGQDTFDDGPAFG